MHRHMKRIGSGQLMVTEGDKIVLPNNVGLIGASRLAPPQAQHQQLLLHSIQEDGTSQVSYIIPECRALMMTINCFCKYPAGPSEPA